MILSYHNLGEEKRHRIKASVKVIEKRKNLVVSVGNAVGYLLFCGGQLGDKL